MSLIFTSKLYREEFKHWLLIAALAIWGLTASAFALTNRSQTLVIGIDEVGTRLITNSSDRLIRSETKNFLKSFLDLYYSYDEKNFSENLGLATELMSSDLWDRSKPKLLELNERLKKTPLTQKSEIQSIDLLEPGKIEAVLNLTISSRMSSQKVRLKVHIEFRKTERTQNNSWGFEITEVSDVVI